MAGYCHDVRRRRPRNPNPLRQSWDAVGVDHAEDPTRGHMTVRGAQQWNWLSEAAKDFEMRQPGRARFQSQDRRRRHRPQKRWIAIAPQPSPPGDEARGEAYLPGEQDGIGEGKLIGYVQILEQALAKAKEDPDDKTTPPNSIESPGKTGPEQRRQDPDMHFADLAERLSALPVDGGEGKPEDELEDRPWTDTALEAAALLEEMQAAAVRAAEALAAAAAAANGEAKSRLEEGANAVAQAARTAAAVRTEDVAIASQDAVLDLLGRAQATALLRQETERPEVGDVVTLGSRAPEEHRGAAAVVTAVAEKHCTVVVLDESRRFGAGECWPSFEDLKIEVAHLRLDSKVRLVGLQGARTGKLNGFTGKICTHKREGHPIFIRKPSDPDKPQLTMCVRLDEPELAGERQVLVEPRFLEPVE